MTGIGPLLLDALDRHPERVALRQGGTELTYAATARAVHDLAARLAAAGLGPGDTLVQLRGNDPAQWITAAACYVAGVRVCSVAPGSLPPAELARRLELIGPSVVVTAPEPVAGAGCGAVRRWVVDGSGVPARPADRAGHARPDPAGVPAGGAGASAGGSGVPAGGSADLAAAGPVGVPAAGPDRIAARLAFTSGTGGTVKGVDLSGAALGAVATMCAEQLPWPQRPVVVCPEAVSGGFGNMVLPVLLHGGTFVLPARSGVDGLVQTLAAEPGAVLALMPPLLRSLLADPRTGGLPVPRLVLYSGDDLAAADTAALRAWGDPGLCGVFGQVEVPKTIALALPAVHCTGTGPGLGTPFAGTRTRLVDLAGHDVTGDGPGELWVSGPTVLTGYAFGAPDPFDGGWVRTGDVCRRDDDGRLQHAGRVEDVLTDGPAPLCPPAVEAALRAATGVPAAVLRGRDGGTVVVAAGRIEPRTAAAVLDGFGLVADRVVGRDGGLPRTPMGRFDRRALEREHR
ncbi:class I adenylate-forming enzyme family protein [Pseudonocardia sp. NPDC046786]|uniref:class I adenylate-forming enzyme family protein n=1 Tax=Pseudonocardia sp. NPDC046786 TaxID=3155471 RepID=UPI0033CA9786